MKNLLKLLLLFLVFHSINLKSSETTDSSKEELTIFEDGKKIKTLDPKFNKLASRLFSYVNGKFFYFWQKVFKMNLHYTNNDRSFFYLTGDIKRREYAAGLPEGIQTFIIKFSLIGRDFRRIDLSNIHECVIFEKDLPSNWNAHEDDPMILKLMLKKLDELEKIQFRKFELLPSKL
jgi:hypothetical protein